LVQLLIPATALRTPNTSSVRGGGVDPWAWHPPSKELRKCVMMILTSNQTMHACFLEIYLWTFPEAKTARNVV